MVAAIVPDDDALPPPSPRFGRGDRVRARRNDAHVPVGTEGTVLGPVPETGNVWVLIAAGTRHERPVAFTPDQLELLERAAPTPLPVAPASGWEPFAPARKPKPATARVSADGIRLSATAAEMLAGARRVEVLLDRRRGAIGLRPCGAGAGYAVPKPDKGGAVRLQVPGLGTVLAPEPPLPPGRTRRVTPALPVSRDPDGVLVVAGVAFAEGA